MNASSKTYYVDMILTLMYINMSIYGKGGEGNEWASRNVPHG